MWISYAWLALAKILLISPQSSNHVSLLLWGYCLKKHHKLFKNDPRKWCQLFALVDYACCNKIQRKQTKIICETFDKELRKNSQIFHCIWCNCNILVGNMYIVRNKFCSASPKRLNESNKTWNILRVGHFCTSLPKYNLQYCVHDIFHILLIWLS